jgi:hypothetical protein
MNLGEDGRETGGAVSEESRDVMYVGKALDGSGVKCGIQLYGEALGA